MPTPPQLTQQLVPRTAMASAASVKVAALDIIEAALNGRSWEAVQVDPSIQAGEVLHRP